ncbi:MAG: arsenical pump-driving ATPase [Pirellula sp.]|nr:arsenical pump-driving ATPase [Pirellula sp.]
MKFLDTSPRNLFFTGKGGVGKTSLACAAAVTLADRGKRVLLVSTDPASNLGQVFGVEVGEHEPTAIPHVAGLFALNINPEAAAQAYRDRIVGPVRNALPPDVVKGMEEQLSGACTTEIAAFDEFTGLLTGDAVTDGFDHIIFDTAPTGHTLRLLQLPTAWSNFLEDNESGASCLGPLSGLEKQRQRYSQAVGELANSEHTLMVLVTRAQQGALVEAERTSGELASLGITNQRLVVNGVMPEAIGEDPLAKALRNREQAVLGHVPEGLSRLPTELVPLQPRNLVGVEALRALLLPVPESLLAPTREIVVPCPSLPPLAGLVDEIEADGHGLIMVMGKGGVGKTTIAAAIAVELAARGHAVHLTTTDPAAHLAMTVEMNLPGLEVDRIDPHAESERYRQHVLETKGDKLDAAGKTLLEEDLRSPCTEEIAVFQAFSRVQQESRKKFVVVDTAPTGHTLLLLDATGAYHRDVVRNLPQGMHVVTPMMRLQDPKLTKMVIVTLPETTPVLEAEALQADLRRAGIEPWAWVVNSSLAATGTNNPLLALRAKEEAKHIEHVQHFVPRVALVPWQIEPPTGANALRSLAAGPVFPNLN